MSKPAIALVAAVLIGYAGIGSSGPAVAEDTCSCTLRHKTMMDLRNFMEGRKAIQQETAEAEAASEGDETKDEPSTITTPAEKQDGG